MILVDLSQIMMACTVMSMEKGQTEAEMDFVRHMVLNSLRMYREKYNDEYGELVLCCDDMHSWRRDYFPQYKLEEELQREESPLNWTQIFGCFNTLKSELREVFPYKVLQVEGAEYDIIGVLSRYSSITKQKTMIVSSDKDFIQLHDKYVHQWSPVTKKLVNGIEPSQYLFEHILKGDKSDGIPNILSTDDSIINGVRQKPITKKYIDNFVLHND